MYCLNNLRQLGLSISNHQTQTGVFPSAFMGEACDDSGTTGNLSALYAILPYIDRSGVYDQIDLCADYNGSDQDPAQSVNNAIAIQTTIPVFRCPSDRVPPGGNSYRVSMGTSTYMHETVSPGMDADDMAKVGGLAGVRGASPRKITDGLSQTVFLSERLVGDGDRAHYVPWRDIYFVESRLLYPSEAQRGCRLPAGSNPPHWSFVGSTWLYAGHSHTWFNHITTPNGALLDCLSGPSASVTGATAARSNHRGGVNISLGDASGRFVSDAIDLKVWRAVGTRAGDEMLTAPW